MVICKRLLNGSGVEKVKKLQRATEPWYPKKPGMALGENAVSVAEKTARIEVVERIRGIAPPGPEEPVGKDANSVSVEITDFWRCRNHE